MNINKKYKCIIIDPPWNQGKTGLRKVRPNQNKVLDYSTMSKKDLLDMPINTISDNQSFLWLWATNSKDKITKEPILKIAFELMEKWGFTFHTMITWDKKTGACPFSPYQITTEHILFGCKGKVVFPKESLGKLKTCFTETSTAHSVKPDSFYRKIDELFEGEKIDIFARQKRKGFDGLSMSMKSVPENKAKSVPVQIKNFMSFFSSLL